MTVSYRSRQLRALVFSAIAGTALICATLAPAPAQAQAVVAMVNGNPITSFDVDQRIRIIALTTRRTMSRPQATQDLIDDQLKIQEARRIGYRLNDDNIDDQMSRVARSNGQNIPEFLANLSKAGIDGSSYRKKLRADYSWDIALQSKFKGETAASSNEVNAIVESKLKDGGAKVTDFEVHSIIFVVSRTDGNAGTRERQANAARAGFRNCEDGLEMLRKLPDVAVKPLVKRSSDVLSANLLALLNKTPVGSMTPAFRSEQGIEAIAVCGKSERIDTSSIRSNAEKEISSKKAGKFAEEYLAGLRTKALIQYR